MTQRIPPDVAAQVARLFASESEAVFATALQAARGNRHEAEDLVQEAFQAAALNWDTIADYSSDKKRAWLRRVAINKAIDRYRARKPVRLAADVDLVREVPSAEHAALTRIQRDLCLKTINDMPKRRRTVAYLKFHEEWNNKEIASYLGISPSTVRAQLRAARVMIDEAVGPEVSLTGELDEQADACGEEER
jgi:RNA polymerase sigma-70 factor (ECF subfamily)